MKKSGLDNDPNSIFRASRTVRKIINKKLKEDQDAKNAQQQTLTAPIKSNTETDVNKNLSQFILDIKQINTLLSAFNIQIYNDVSNVNDDIQKYENKPKNKRKFLSRVGIEPEEESGSEEEESVASSRYSSVGESSVGESGSEEEESGSEEEESGSEGRKSKSNSGSSFDDTTRSNTDYEILMNSYIRDINRIILLIDHSIVLWEDNIKSNINYLSKVKMTNFVNSKTMDEFKTNLEELQVNLHLLEEYEKILSKDDVSPYENIVKHGDRLLTKSDELYDLINSDIAYMSGVQKGTINGAGFLHIPTPYNSYLQNSSKKYLM
jgi:hypothetical protein